MSRMQNFERRLEAMVSGSFAKMFRSEVEPVEIASALQREVDQQARVVSRDRALAPNRFYVQLSQADHDRLEAYQDSLVRELTGLVVEHAEMQRYSFPGEVEVNIEPSAELTVGQFRVRSEAKAGTSSTRGAGQRRAVAYLVVNDVVHDVPSRGLTIGRGTEADLRISDPGISRVHAEVRVLGEGSKADLEIIDQQSTNGTVVDGQRVAHTTLHDGAVIKLGGTRLTLHRRDPRERS